VARAQCRRPRLTPFETRGRRRMKLILFSILLIIISLFERRSSRDQFSHRL
jgi:hypothetical protein